MSYYLNFGNHPIEVYNNKNPNTNKTAIVDNMVIQTETLLLGKTLMKSCETIFEVGLDIIFLLTRITLKQVP